ncbi:hypothetical protein [Burkholderia sp. BCC1972]|uniref:hypothetical protein n=1 Tax=Burkholderia sp. BCC1972 TaxID=2817438 RepID=UPI002ABDB86F|nr:hypothetical protein [Burkholderia sp. BCC1972]
MKLNNLAMGLGVAVLGFAVVQYFKGQQARNTGLSTLTNPNAGATWQSLTFPLGTATGGVNMTGGVDNVYSSTSWNPDALGAAIGQDAAAAMNATGQGTLNSWGFTLP